jgi:hypothetical protein
VFRLGWSGPVWGSFPYQPKLQSEDNTGAAQSCWAGLLDESRDRTGAYRPDLSSDLDWPTTWRPGQN